MAISACPTDDVYFIQHMVPCVNDNGKFMLESKDHVTDPNGHGGCIQAIVEHEVLDDARRRGIDTLCYFQVDNWAVKVTNPYFIGYHIQAEAEISSKNHRKHKPREAVGVLSVRWRLPCNRVQRVGHLSPIAGNQPGWKRGVLRGKPRDSHSVRGLRTTGLRQL